MTYSAIESQIRSLPEEYLDEVSDYIEYILFKANKNKVRSKNSSSYFGSIGNSVDGLEFQRNIRNE